MAKQTLRVPMYHPWKKDRDGNPAIQQINPKTVRSGKASLMGYTPVPVVTAPPVPPPPAKVTTVKKGATDAN